MKKTINTKYTDQEFRQLIREELKAVLNGESEQIGGESGFIDINQAAEFLKLKAGTLYQQVHNKTIPFHKSGRRVLFKKVELAEWVKKGDE